eukprot:459949-Hanusia_phi.AAC.1
MATGAATAMSSLRSRAMPPSPSSFQLILHLSLFPTCSALMHLLPDQFLQAYDRHNSDTLLLLMLLVLALVVVLLAVLVLMVILLILLLLMLLYLLVLVLVHPTRACARDPIRACARDPI